MGIKELLRSVTLIIDTLSLIFMLVLWCGTEDRNGKLTCWVVNLILVLNLAALLVR